MPAYVIADVDVSDPAKYEGYKALTPGAIAAAGGKFIARGGEVAVLEGDWKPARVVVLEFADLDAARAARAKRAGATTRFNMVVVQGI
jgi:uncharacterized protein (DUF1330 family)